MTTDTQQNKKVSCSWSAWLIVQSENQITSAGFLSTIDESRSCFSAKESIIQCMPILFVALCSMRPIVSPPYELESFCRHYTLPSHWASYVCIIRIYTTVWYIHNMSANALISRSPSCSYAYFILHTINTLILQSAHPLSRSRTLSFFKAFCISISVSLLTNLLHPKYAKEFDHV